MDSNGGSWGAGMDDVDSGHLKDECREALERIYHYLDGELTPQVRSEIKRHLDDCPPCIDAFHFEAELRVVIARGCQERVPETLRVRIATLIEEQQRLI